MKKVLGGTLLAACALALGIQTAHAFDIDLHGSLGEGENKFHRYVAPVASPTFNESPYITTELRPILMHNAMPNDWGRGQTRTAGLPTINGGAINVMALQARVALTDRLAIIATKDGFGEVIPNNLLPKENGSLNIAAGVKYALINNPKEEGILSIGARYEGPSGNLSLYNQNLGLPPIALQGGGDGFMDVFLTGAKSYGKVGLQASIGHHTALDQDLDNSTLHWGAHVDYEFLPGFFPLVEFNGFSTTTDASRLRGVGLPNLNTAGIDLVNFGSGYNGTVITTSAGARIRITDHIMMGAVYSRPVTDRQDIMSWRTTFDLIFYY